MESLGYGLPLHKPWLEVSASFFKPGSSYGGRSIYFVIAFKVLVGMSGYKLTGGPYLLIKSTAKVSSLTGIPSTTLLTIRAISLSITVAHNQVTPSSSIPGRKSCLRHLAQSQGSNGFSRAAGRREVCCQLSTCNPTGKQIILCQSSDSYINHNSEEPTGAVAVFKSIGGGTAVNNRRTFAGRLTQNNSARTLHYE